MSIRLLSCVLAMLGALAGCHASDDGITQNTATSGPDAGVCTRDLAALNDLLAHPVACVGPAQCPAGAYCDTQRGACDFECTSDSACGPGGICGCDGHCQGGGGGGGQGGTCERSAGLLQSAAARTCTADAQCGTGMTCDLVAHSCVVRTSCTSNAQCPMGATCPTSGAGANTCVPTACTKDTDCTSGVPCDIASGRCQIFAPRSCVFDDECPNGSRCDDGTRTCRNDCASDSNCASGQACDCFGRCVTPGVSPAPPSARLVRLDVSPRRNPIIDTSNGTTAWAARRIEIALRAPDQTRADAVVSAPVFVRASPGLLVACGGATPPSNTSQYRTTCQMPVPWTFQPVGPQRHAINYVWVKPAPPATGATFAIAGDVELTSDMLSGTPAFANFGPADSAPMGTPPDPAQYGIDGEYRGTVTPTGVTSLDQVNAAPSATPTALSVRAWASQGQATPLATTIDMYDPSGSLAAGGKIRVSGAGTVGTTVFADWLKPIDDEPGTQALDAYGEMTAKLESDPPQFDATTGTLRGTFRVRLLQSTHGDVITSYRYELHQIGARPTCAAGCAADTTCDKNLGSGGGTCEAGPVWVGRTDAQNTIASNRFQKWFQWLDALAKASAFGQVRLYTNDLYNGQTGWASATFQGPGPAPIMNGQLILSEVVAASDVGSRGDGMDICRNDFFSYFKWLDAAVLGNKPLLAVIANRTADGGAVKSNIEAACGAFYQLSCAPGLGCSQDVEGEVAQPAAAKDYAPCIDGRAPTGTGDYFALLQGGDERGGCEAVYARYKDATGTTLTRDQFIDSTCQDTFEVLRLGYESTPGTYTTYPVRLCPFKPQLLSSSRGTGSASYADQLDAQQYECFDPDQRTLPLESAFFESSEKLDISQQPTCKGGRIPHGAELIFDADRAAANHTEPTGAGSMLQICMAELTDMPRATSSINASTLRDSYTETFGDHGCISWPHLVGAISTAPGSATKLDVLGQWANLHGFIAKEGAQADAMATAVLGGADLDPTDRFVTASTPTDTQLLSQLERGWNLLLASSNVEDLVGVTGTSESGMTLAVTMVDTAALHLDVIERYLRKAQLATYDQCHAGDRRAAAAALEVAGRGLRYAQSARALANRLFDRAATKSCSVAADCGAASATCADSMCVQDHAFVRNNAYYIYAGGSRWASAQTQYDAAYDRVVAAANLIEVCASPLDVAESQVPLFFGDVDGPSSRFFAASDYLLTGWAKPAVDRAKAAMDAARGAWLQKRDSQIQQVLNNQEAERRRDGISSQYGQQLVDICGLDGVSAKDALELFTEGDRLTADTCFIDRQRGDCRVLAGEIAGTAQQLPAPQQRVTEDEARYTLCTWSGLRGPLGIIDGDPRKLFADHWADAKIIKGGEPLVVAVQVPDGSGTKEENAAFLFQTSLAGVAADKREHAQAVCADALGGKAAELPTSQEVRRDTPSQAACFHGQLGEHYLGVATAQRDIELAAMDLDDARSAYDIKLNSCIELAETQSKKAALRKDHQETMFSWRMVLDAYGAGQQLALAAAGSSADTSKLDLWAIVMGEHVQSLQEDFDAEMQALDDTQALRDCGAEAKTFRLRIDNAAAVIRRAVGEADRSIVAFNNLRTTVRILVADGPAALAREENRRVPDIAFHYWLDEKVDRFEKDFEWARALTYRAMLAVEFEYQESLSIRGAILTATHPDQLLDAIAVMEQTQISRTINGKRPEPDTIVRSLRDDILDLRAVTPARTGERSLSASERLQRRLWAESFEVRDDDGKYLGQGIPFSLGAEGELEYTCAERVWRVTATLQGDLLGDKQPAVPLLLMKRNHFTSQWCDGRGDDTAYQTAAAQPVSELFPSDEHGGSEAVVNSYATAHIRPWLNVPRSELYREEFNQGASSELAGRGLYGDYILLFPAAGLLDEGFPLERVEDVLLRFDYLAVDNINISHHVAGPGAGAPQ